MENCLVSVVSTNLRVMRNFQADLESACNEAAKFLRGKNAKWNEGIREEKQRYSGEREFLSEIYYLLVNRDKYYREHLFVDYMPAVEFSGSKRRLPDLVYRAEEANDKGVLEVKVLVDKRVNEDPTPYSSDKNLIDEDYKKTQAVL
jgi:hypothetical protein